MVFFPTYFEGRVIGFADELYVGVDRKKKNSKMTPR